MKKLLKRADKSHSIFQHDCEEIAKEAQKYIDWDDNIGCGYYAGSGLCIEATAPPKDGYWLNQSAECLCTVSAFISLIEGKNKVSYEEFFKLCF